MRTQWRLVAVLIFTFMAHGAWWALTAEAPSPIDEVQHLGYVDAVARGVLPVAGRDHVPLHILELLERSPTWDHGPAPIAAEAAAYGHAGMQYEAHQGPLVYLLLAGPYRLLAGGGEPLRVLLGLRLVGVVLAATAVPAVWYLGRAAFGGRPAHAVWSAALAVAIPGIAANTAAVSNDVLVVPLAAGLLVPVAFALRRGPSWWHAVAVGCLAGLAALTKVTLLGVVAVALTGGLWSHRVHGRRSWDAARWLLLALLAVTVVAGWWVAWQLQAYGGRLGGQVVADLLAPVEGRPGLSASTVGAQLRRGLSGFFESHLVPRGLPPRSALMLAGLLVVLVVIAVRSARGHERHTAWLLAVSIPVVIVVHLVIVFAVAEGGTATIGRLWYGLVPGLLVAAAAGAAALRRVPGRVVVAGVGALAAVAGAVLAAGYPVPTWGRPVVDGAIPVREATSADRWLVGTRVEIRDLPCHPTLLAFAVRDEGTPTLEADLDGGAVVLRRDDVTPSPLGYAWVRYRAPEPLQAPFDVSLAGMVVTGTHERSGADWIGFSEEPGRPAARVYCAVDDPVDERLGRSFAVMHPDLPAPVVRWGAVAASLLAGSMAAAVTLAASGGAYHRRRPEQRNEGSVRDRDDDSGPAATAHG